MGIMARHTSIFLNMQDYREQVPESQRFHLSDVQDPGFLPSAFKKRISKLEDDVAVQSSLSTDLESLFIVLDLRLKDLEQLPLSGIYRELRTVLKTQARIEIAPPGNITEISRDTKFRICPCFDLNRDPDIVSARQNQGAVNLGRILENRIRNASDKINNFAVSLHVFESLFLVNPPGTVLNTEQRYFLQNFIEKESFPADTQRYLQSCFSQIIDLPPQVNDLSPENAYLKPLRNPDVLNRYLEIISGMAALSEKKTDFTKSPHAERLTELTKRARLKNSTSAEIGTEGTREKALSFILRKEIMTEDVFSDFIPAEAVKNGSGVKSVYGSGTGKIGKHLENARRYFTDNGYADSTMLTFRTGRDVAVIGGLAVDDANVYVAKSPVLAEKRHWDFAVNAEPFAKQIMPDGAGRVMRQISAAENEDGLKHLAMILNRTPNIPLRNDQLYVIGAGLEYRLFVEDVLFGRLTDAERIKTFIMAVNWFRSAMRANDSTSYDLRGSLDYLGSFIAAFAFLNEDKIYESHLSMIHVFPECRDFALYSLSAMHMNGSLTPENALPFIFSGFILSNPAYNLNIRIQGDARPVLYSHAKKIFERMIRTDPELPAKLLGGLVFTDGIAEMKDRYPSLSSYKNKVIAPLLPPAVTLAAGAQERINRIVTAIKKEQENFLTYLGSAGSNVCNDLVYRIYEHSLSGEDRLPEGLRNFRKSLLNSGRNSFSGIRQLFNLNISYHSCCAQIISECASVLNVTIFPNFDFESGDLVVNLFDYVTFGEQKLETHPYNRRLILPYRIILNTCTGFKTIKLVHEFFCGVLARKQLKELQDYSDSQLKDLQTYIDRITEIKMSTNLRCRFRSVSEKNRYEFDGLQKVLFRSLFRILITGGETEQLSRIVHGLNRQLTEPVIDEKDLNGRMFTASRSSCFGGLPDHDELVPKVNSPDNLDMDLISRTASETRKVQEILAPIFEENEPEYSAAGNTKQDSGAEGSSPAVNVTASGGSEASAQTPSDTDTDDGALGLLAPEYRSLLKRLLQVGEFSMSDFKSFCSEKKLMASGAMEVINSWALEQFGCTILEEDEPMFFDRELLTELL